MKPIAIFRFTDTEGPGYLTSFFDRHGLPWQLIPVEQAHQVPERIDVYAGLVLMGGPMSVNDDLDWLPPILQRIRDAVAQKIPVLGHCLGGQLMSRALGGVVTANPGREIGWGEVYKCAPGIAPDWLDGLPERFTVFQWHGETFSLPPGSEHLLASQYCAHQAYLLDNLHLGLQCHIEMTAAMLRVWCSNGATEIAEHPGPGVQPPQVIQENMAAQLEQLHGVADILYSRWIHGLKQT
jgi:GMP synthase-like glutamine amidotransferase